MNALGDGADGENADGIRVSRRVQELRDFSFSFVSLPALREGALYVCIVCMFSLSP